MVLIGIHLFDYFLLTYNSCTGGYTGHLHMCLQCILVSFTPPLFSFIPPPLFLEQFWQVSLFYFRTWIQNTFTIFAFLHSFFMPSPLSLVPTPRQDLFYLPALHFLKVYIDSSRVFHLGISDMHLSCFNQINSPIVYFLYCPVPLLFNTLQCIELYYLWLALITLTVCQALWQEYVGESYCKPNYEF
jgi:hypothetical protein